MSETPRTDAFVDQNEAALKAGFNDWPDFAGQLERELTAVTAKCDRLLEALDELESRTSCTSRQYEIIREALEAQKETN